MSTPTGSNLYSQGFGTTSTNTFTGNAIVQPRAPVSTDVRGPSGPYTIGQLWVDTSDSSSWQLVSFSASNGIVSATWSNLGGGAESLSQLTGSSGTALPTNGSIEIAGSNGITTSAANSVVTIALSGTPSPITKGTYLPNLQFGGASTGITYASQNGYYLVIGTPGSGNALVMATGFIVLSSKGSSTGNASISNLPYACYSFQAIGGANAAQAITIDAGYASLLVRANTLSTSMDILEAPAAGTATAQILVDTNFSDTTGLSYTIIYQA